jgi:hypothetical protein
MVLVPTLTETLATTALGAGLTWATSWLNHRSELRRLRFQRSKEKADGLLRAVSDLELVGPVPGPLLGGEGPHAGSGALPDPAAARVAVAAVKNAALLVDDRLVRSRVGKAVSFLDHGVLPGGFKTLPLDYVWTDACRDIRTCVAAYANGEKLPASPPMYEHYDRLLAPLHEKLAEAYESVRKYAASLEAEGK